MSPVLVAVAVVLSVGLSVAIWRQVKEIRKMRAGSNVADRFLSGVSEIRQYRSRLNTSDLVFVQREEMLGKLSVLSGHIARNWGDVAPSDTEMLAGRMDTISAQIDRWEGDEGDAVPEGHATLSEAAASFQSVSDRIRNASTA